MVAYKNLRKFYLLNSPILLKNFSSIISHPKIFSEYFWFILSVVDYFERLLLLILIFEDLALEKYNGNNISESKNVKLEVIISLGLGAVAPL